jgi:hypothetical protein
MVTFVERTQDPDPLGLLEEEPRDDTFDQDIHIPQRPAAMLDDIVLKKKPIKQSGKGEKQQQKPKKRHRKPSASKTFKVERIDEDKLYDEPIPKPNGVNAKGSSKAPYTENGDTHGNSMKTIVEDPVKFVQGPVSVDECADEEEEKKIESSSGPRQAHFYHVIMERDMAQQTVKKLNRELRHTRSRVRDLKAKLERSKALNELSVREPKSDTKPKSSLFAKKAFDGSSVRGTRRRSWFPGSSSATNEESIVEFVTEAELSVGSRGDRIASEAAAEHEYMKAIVASDADRAGGYQQVRCDI